MNQRKTSSVLNLKYTSLAKLLVGATKGKLTGCIKIKEHKAKPSFVIWYENGNIVGVTGIAPIIEKLEMYGFVSKRVIEIIKAENLIAPIGEKLRNVYQVHETEIQRLYDEQIEEIYIRLSLTEGAVTIAKVKHSTFPWQELTGLKVSGYQIVKNGLEQYFSSRYRDKVPERQRTINSGAVELDAVKFDKTYLRIISFCNTNATLISIAKKMELKLSEVQKKIYILNTLEIVELGISKDAAMELYRKFNPNAKAVQGRHISFNRQNNWKVPFISISGINLAILLLTVIGTFQDAELGLLDSLIRLRGTQKNRDIVIVTMDDQDIAQFPSYPVPDRYLAQVINNIAKANPTGHWA